MKIHKTCAATLTALCCCTAAVAQVSDDAVKIGVIVDMTGPYSTLGGMGVVRAVELAVKDFGGSVLGKPVQVLTADYQNKPDIAALKAREWFDKENVDVIVEVTDSAASLAILKVATAKKKPHLMAGASSYIFSNQECSPYGVQWSYTTYALANSTGRAMVQDGGSSWFFVTIDYAFGESLERDTTNVVKQMGGQVVGSAKHPLNAADLSSQLLMAQASKAKVIGLANSATDTQMGIRQAAEFGLTKNQKLAALLAFDSDIKGVGLPLAQGLVYTTAFYWDRNQETRDFAKRFYDVHKSMPNMVSAGAYSAASHYLKAVAATKTDKPEVVLKQMQDTPVNDVFAKNGQIRPDRLMVHDMYLLEVKKPSESKGEWDIANVKRTIPGAEAFQPLAASTCPLAKKSS